MGGLHLRSYGDAPSRGCSSRHIGDFTRWKEPDAYSKALEQLLRDLKIETS